MVKEAAEQSDYQDGNNRHHRKWNARTGDAPWQSRIHSGCFVFEYGVTDQCMRSGPNALLETCGRPKT
jgi:hypothetical protein